MNSTDLPAPVNASLSQAFDPEKKELLIGPIRAVTGDWLFRIVSIKKGGALRPFREVKPEIRARLSRAPITILDMPLSQREQFLSDEALAEGYWRKVMMETPEPSDEDARNAVKNHTVDPEAIGTPAAAPEEFKLMAVKQQLKDRLWGKVLTEWKDACRINRDYIR